MLAPAQPNTISAICNSLISLFVMAGEKDLAFSVNHQSESH